MAGCAIDVFVSIPVVTPKYHGELGHVHIFQGLNVPRESPLLSYIPQHLFCWQKQADLPLQDAVPLVSSYAAVAVSYHAPLLRVNLEARLCSLECVNDPLRRQPRSKHLSFRNSFSSMTATFSVHPRPLGSQLISWSRHIQVTHRCLICSCKGCQRCSMMNEVLLTPRSQSS
jgi:hypothetical protein